MQLEIRYKNKQMKVMGIKHKEIEVIIDKQKYHKVNNNLME